MARIRTIKPEFWTDDLLGSLSREARLLFIGTWNMADDEGLLRWSAPFVKGAIFPFDDDLSVKDVQKLMAEIEGAGVVFSYAGGRSQQALGYVVNFHKHQKINRPSPSRLPPPSLQDQRAKDMYASRDAKTCHLCGQIVDEKWSEKYQGDFLASPDHFKPRARGGSDYPSNIRTAHVTCNKGRGDRTPDEYRDILRTNQSVAQRLFPERFTQFSSPDSLNDSVPERERESDHGAGSGETEHGAGASEAAAAPDDDLALLPKLDRTLEGQAFAMWQAHAKLHGWPDPMFLNSTRRLRIRAILGICSGLDGWTCALDAAVGAKFLKTEDGQWQPWFHIDWLLDEEKFTRLMEGRYAERHRDNGKQSTTIADLAAWSREGTG